MGPSQEAQTALESTLVAVSPEAAPGDHCGNLRGLPSLAMPSGDLLGGLGCLRFAPRPRSKPDPQEPFLLGFFQ